MQLILSQTTSCALPPLAWAPFRSYSLPQPTTYSVINGFPPPSSIPVSAHTFGGYRESRQADGESRRTAFGPSALSGTVFSCDRSVCTRFGSREGERMISGASGCHLLWQTQGPPETEPDRLFLLHFLSQDSFPWGLYPSFSSPLLLLTPPWRGLSKKLTQVLLPRTSPSRL